MYGFGWFNKFYPTNDINYIKFRSGNGRYCRRREVDILQPGGGYTDYSSVVACFSSRKGAK
jgi:hypothetical protein